jgi:hypothetical protein
MAKESSKNETEIEVQETHLDALPFLVKVFNNRHTRVNKRLKSFPNGLQVVIRTAYNRGEKVLIR